MNQLKKTLPDPLSKVCFPKVFLSHDGRVIDRTHGFSGSTTSEQNELEIRAQMNQFEYGFGVNIAVRSEDTSGPRCIDLGTPLK